MNLDLFEFFNIPTPFNWFWWCVLFVVFAGCALLLALSVGLLGWLVLAGVVVGFVFLAVDLWSLNS
ncbi:MAG: hypothetical protein AAF641_16415 [Pseudomonadota bacterium]